jgi:aspartyl-tRNA(Asn)/glutamyl-tRNA(Gln) amidotransferase subunit C
VRVSEKDVVYVAGLANLELTGDERVRMVRDLNSVLGYMERLNEVDTTSVEPMTQATRVHDRGSTSREDRFEGLRKSLPHGLAVANAPDTDGTFFIVPKVIER